MLKSHHATVEMLTKGHAKVLEDLTKEIEVSKKTISETTEKVEKLHQHDTSFMVEFRTSDDINIEAMNKVIAGFQTSLHAKKEALSLVLSQIKLNNTEQNAYVVLKIEKLQKDLAAKNNIMDKLAEKTEKAKILLVKLQ